MQSGQTVRTVISNKPRIFTVAEVLYEEDDRDFRCGNGGVPRDVNRWGELVIVKTAKGKIAMRDSWRTKWQGEHERNTWTLFDTEKGAAGFLGTFAAGGTVDEEAEFNPLPALARHALKELGWWDLIAEEV